MTKLLVVLAATALAACHDPGPYGHSPHYAATDGEAAAVAGAREYDPVMAERQPDLWRSGSVSLFGVVQSRAVGPRGQAKLKVAIRRLEPRNLCEAETDDGTCRVTVSDRDFGEVWVLLSLHGDDDTGPRSVGPRSLLRIVGRLGEEPASEDGAPVVHATWYRHWPAFYYVTSASARDMRQ